MSWRAVARNSINRRGRRGFRRGRRVIIFINNASYAVMQVEDVEVHYQTKTQISQLEIGENLREMHIVDSFDSFYLQDEPALDHKVNAITAIEPHLRIYQRHRFFLFGEKPHSRQLK